MRSYLLAALVALLGFGCGGASIGTESTGSSSSSSSVSSIGVSSSSLSSSSSSMQSSSSPTVQWYTPPLSASWQIQLRGDPDTSYAVTLYDLDLYDTPQAVIDALHAKNSRVICYFSAGTYENWRDDASRFTAAEIGAALPEWEGENWLDIRTQNVRSIMQARLNLAVEKGCDGVDPDNVDGYSNQNGLNLSAADQLEYNIFIAEAAHERGLAVGLKNDLDQVAALEPYFDFSINEQCFAYDECNLLAPFTDASKPVFSIEYDETYVNDAAARAQLCAEADALSFQTLVMPLSLDGSFRYACGVL